MTPSKAFLIIMDGWGHGPTRRADALALAKTPFIDSLYLQYPSAELVTYGEDVGLPEGQMGNSEVGHLNIGAGRVVYQELARINKDIREGVFQSQKTILDAFEYANINDKAVHFLGLVSDGGVHSHISHLKALCDMATNAGIQKGYIHAFTDGRDCDPKSGLGFIQELLHHIESSNIQLASVIGRYYAMDRDKRWERVKLAYDLLVHGTSTPTTDILSSIQECYSKDVTDEFLPPFTVGPAPHVIKEGDVVICYNFRTDRLRELTQVLSQMQMPEYGMTPLALKYITMTRYDETFKAVEVVYHKEDITLTLGEVISNAGKNQVRIAETEKYPHVTFFFSGGREKEFPGERRLLVPSPKVATYDLQPQMSAYEIAATISEDIASNAPDFICLNFANADMVGHTGVFSAAMEAAHAVDNCMEKVVSTALRHGYQIIVIADHGNSDYMINEDGSPNTAHTMNPVPVILVAAAAKEKYTVRNGRLADVAPTLLELMGLDKPAAMDGQSLLRKI